MEELTHNYDSQTDTLRILWSTRQIAESSEHPSGVIVDLDAQGQAVGVEVLNLTTLMANCETAQNGHVPGYIRFCNDLIPFDEFAQSAAIWNAVRCFTDPKDQARNAIRFDLQYGPYAKHGHRAGHRIATVLLSEEEQRILSDEMDVQNPERWPVLVP